MDTVSERVMGRERSTRDSSEDRHERRRHGEDRYRDSKRRDDMDDEDRYGDIKRWDDIDDEGRYGDKKRERKRNNRIDDNDAYVDKKSGTKRNNDRDEDDESEEDRKMARKRERDDIRDNEDRYVDKKWERKRDSGVDDSDRYGDKKSERNKNNGDENDDSEEDRKTARERERDNNRDGEDRYVDNKRERKRDCGVDDSDRNGDKKSERKKNSDRDDEDSEDRKIERKRERGDYRNGDKKGERKRDRGDDRDVDRKREQRRDDERHMSHGHDYYRGRKNDDDRENEEGRGKKKEQPLVHVTNSIADTKFKSGGVYIPPFKLARMLNQVEDKSSPEYQRLTWDALRKSINGLINKVNATNIKNIIPELFAENLIRGRGLFCRSCMKSQMASPGFSDVFAALVAVVNTKFPEVGDLLLRRVVLQLKRAYKRNDKPQLLAVVKFIAHLVNQQVAHELIALELLTLLLENPTDDSVEVAVGFVTECGSILQDLCPKGLHGIFERFRGILHEGEIDKRVQFLIEGLFAIRKAKFTGHPAVRPELDLVEQEDQLTLEMSLMDEIDPETSLDIFKPNPQYVENEKRYEELKRNMLGEESEDEDGDVGSDDDDEDDEDDEDDDDDEEQMQIKDETETNLVNLRRTIYLTIMSSVDFEEAGHKLLKIKLEPGQEMELCIMLLECCSQERTYLRYYGLLGQRFCMINKIHQENFETCFVQQYSMIHRLETNKLRNVAKFFAHLLGTDALPWNVLEYIRLTEEDTTSSSRIFIKILFQAILLDFLSCPGSIVSNTARNVFEYLEFLIECNDAQPPKRELSEQLGIRLLNERLSDPIMQSSFDSIFPKDNPKNTRFAINFFTSIGLGGITENLREYLKNMPRLIMEQQKAAQESDSDGSDSSGSSSDSSASESESESSSSSESEEDRRRSRKRSKRN